jgi:hypothetical protein
VRSEFHDGVTFRRRGTDASRKLTAVVAGFMGVEKRNTTDESVGTSVAPSAGFTDNRSGAAEETVKTPLADERIPPSRATPFTVQT